MTTTTEVPAHLAELTADDPRPATVNIDDPCPDDVGAAVECLWAIVRDMRHQLDRLAPRM